MRDQLAEHAAAAGQVADLGARRVVEAERQEAGELGARVREHPERRVLRACQLLCRRKHPLEHDLDVELGENAPRDVQHA